MAKHYDAVVLGSGQAGNPLASDLAGRGKKVAVIESEHIGGTCINEGCTPTKTMVASARVAYLASRAADFGVELASPPKVDLARVRERKRGIVDSFRSGSEKRLDDTENIDRIMGLGRFTDPHTLEVALAGGGNQTLEADNIFVNTGTRPRILDVEGLSNVPYLTNKSIMELATVPEHLIVIGGGYIGVEFGQMFRRFGAEVTIVSHGPRFLSREDRDIGEELAKILADEGVNVMLNAQPTRFSRSGDRIEAVIDTESGEEILRGSHVLLSVGRVPNSDGIGLAEAGVEVTSRGHIRVDEHLQTSREHIYALGDVKGGPAFTHISYDDYRIVADHLFGSGKRSSEGRMVPYTLFTDPQLGRIGLTEEQATEAGYEIKVAKIPGEWVARSIEVDDTRGLLKAVVDAKTGLLLGAAMLSTEGGELSTMIQLAMQGGLTYEDLRDATLPHPTYGESLNNLFSMI